MDDGITSRFVEIDGIRTHVLEAGEGPLLVLLHGAGLAIDSRLTWLRQFEDLARDHRVVAFDQIGFGRTALPPGGAYPGRADRVPHAIAVMRTLGLSGGTVVGHSEGGFIALAIAIAEPALVGRLVVVTSGSAAPMFDDARDDSWIAASEAAYNYVLDEIDEEAFLARKRGDLGGWDDRLAGLVRENFRAAQANGQLALHRRMPTSETDMRAYMAVQKERIAPHLASIRVPTRLIWAGDDATVPIERGVALARAIPGADLHVLSGSRHYVMHDRSAAFNALLRGAWSD